MSRLRQKLQAIEKQLQQGDEGCFIVAGLRHLYYDFRHDPPVYRELGPDFNPGRIITEEERGREEAEAIELERKKYPGLKQAVIVRIICDDSPISDFDD